MNSNKILPTNLTQKSIILKKKARSRIQTHGKEHLMNFFRVFNPFNFVTDPDAIRKYNEELKIRSMDPVKRRVYLQEKRFKEKEMKMKADRKYDIKRLENKDKQIKEQIK